MLLGLIGLVAALLLGRGIFGLEGRAVCADDEAALLVANDAIGWSFAPGLTASVRPCDLRASDVGVRKDWAPGLNASVRPCDRGFAAPLQINAEGLADQAWPSPPRSDEVRVLVLGNETADGLTVARQDRLSTRIALLADRTLGLRVAGINATIPGYSTAEERRWLDVLGPRFSPAIVVLLVDAERDLAAMLWPPRPKAATTADTDADDIAPASGLLDLAGLGGLISEAPILDDATAVRIERGAPLLDPADRTKALGLLVAEVRQLDETAQAQGAKLAILIVPPCPRQIADTAASDESLPEIEPGLCKVLEAVAPCTNLAPAFEDLAAAAGGDELCTPATNRWGRDAHFLASHAVWDLLISAGLWPEGVVRGHRL